MRSVAEFSWVMQECLKGDSRLHAINLIPGSHISCEGGWGRNAHYPLWLTLGSMLGLSDLTREDVIAHPLFTPFRSEANRMCSTNLFPVTDTAATPQLRARLLADAIPAESHAAGANYLEALGENSNLRMDVDARSGGYMANYDRWPEKNKDDNVAWKHSSFKQTAYFFTYKLFDYFVKGN